MRSNNQENGQNYSSDTVDFALPDYLPDAWPFFSKIISQTLFKDLAQLAATF